MKNVRVACFGVGVVGGMIAKFLVQKEGVDIVGAIDVAKDKIGRDIGEIIGLGRRLGLRVSDDIDAVMKEKPDIVVHATSSFLKDTFPQIAAVVKHGVNVVSTCEELSYPYVSAPDLAKKLDVLARKHGASVLGTGINPGFLMDALVMALTAPCQKIEKIEVTRLMNASTRRLPFQKKIGAGLTVKGFEERIRRREISGHVGLEQSIGMVAAALCWQLDQIEVEKVEAVVAEKNVESKCIKVKKGSVAGLRQKAKGILNGKEVIVLDFRAYLGADEEYDSVRITGLPNVYEKITPCVHGDIGTVAMIVNSIPKVMNATPGLHSMKDLAIPYAALGNLRDYIVHEK